MEELKTHIDPDAYYKLVEGNIDSLFTILSKSTNELFRLTRVPVELLETIKNKASDIAFKQKFMTAAQVPAWERISTGCASIDTILSGGVPINGISEIYGCSGVGKTQFCLQLALMVQLPRHLGGKEKEVVYICTEDVFPSKRLRQLSDRFKEKYDLQDLDFESRVYLNHSADFEQLRRCLSVSLPKLLRLKNIGLLVIDSIAGIFRSENTDVCYTGRSQDIVTIASVLHQICNDYKVGIVCTNQVTDNLLTGTTEPCLGLAWGGNVTSRFRITRYNNSKERDFEVIFAPDLPNNKRHFVIKDDGLAVI